MLYRRTAAESTVEELELHEAEYEGIEFQWLVTAKRVIGDENGKVIGLEVTHSELGPLDHSGRPRAIPIPGSEEIIPCDMICAAYGQKPESGFLKGLEMTKLDRRGVPIIDDNYMTEIPGLFACGDYVQNPKTFITAIGEGHAAVDAMQEYPDRREADRAAAWRSSNWTLTMCGRGAASSRRRASPSGPRRR